ncbi:MAG: DUF2341 domain-containing protein [Candidatus Bathyarchaeota archaeon]|nr:DUF2341 domain-containing protein [Candidatus Bathyarchaeota archaeon]
MRFKRKLVALIIAALVILVCFISVIYSQTQTVNSVVTPQNWMDGWNYRKIHQIQGSTGAGTDYQIQVTAHYTSGSDLGSDVYLNGKCQTNFGDVRFTGGDGLTPLSYWLESKTDGENAVFWVKVNANLDSNQTIYIYYGNQTVSSASSLEATFPFGDDFSGSSLDKSKWHSFGYGSITVADGKCTLESAATDRGWIYLLGNQQFDVNYSIRFNSMVIEQGDHRWTHHGFATIYNDSKVWGRIDEYPNYITASQEATYYAWALKTRSYQNTSRTDLSNMAPAVGQYFTFEIQRNASTNAILTCNGQLEGTVSTNVSAEPMGAMFSADNTGSYLYSVTAVDWVVIRKYVATEPQHAAWGTAETVLPNSFLNWGDVSLMATQLDF